MPPPNRESVLSPVVLKHVVKTPTLFHSSNVYLAVYRETNGREGRRGPLPGGPHGGLQPRCWGILVLEFSNINVVHKIQVIPQRLG